MTRLTSIITNFNGGEVSPLLDSRVDLDFYQNTCKKLLNFIPRAQGALQRRKGFRYIATTKTFGSGDTSRKTRLWHFIFATGSAYILEFGHNYIRFYQDQQQVVVGGNPLEVATPYTEDEIFELQFAQVADIMYIVHPNHRPKKLSRTDLTPTFALQDVIFQKGPTLDENQTNITLQASATTGTVTITASSNYFNPNMVGGVWAITEPSGSLSAYSAWEPGQSYTSGNFVRNQNNVYVALNNGTSGAIAPTHERGDVSDGGVTWRFVNKGVGYIRFDNYISPTQFSGLVQLRLPNTVVGTPTLFWNEGAWSDDQGWPCAIAFYEQRLFLAGTKKQPQTIWASKTNGRYEDFDTGSGNDDDAMVFTAATNEVDTIKWLGVKTVLLAGTAGGVFVIRSSVIDQIITPSNVQIKKHTSSSCSDLVPELVNNTLIFTQRAGRKILAASYNFETDSFASEDITVRAEHITRTGVKDIDFQQEPYSVLWLVLNDGSLVGATIEQQQKIIAWHKHTTHRQDVDGFLVPDSFESVAVIPTADTDELWVVTKRIIGGEVVRFVELMEPSEFSDYYLDAGVYYDGAVIPAGQLGGFTHLIGERVKVLLSEDTSEGQILAITDDQIVNEFGEITLPYPVTKYAVGLPYYSDYQSHRMTLQLEDGLSLSKPCFIHKVTLRLMNTLGLEIGFDEDHLQRQPFRTTFDQMNNPPPLYGWEEPVDYEIDFDGTWDTDKSTIYIRQRDPLPITIISMSVHVNANTR